MFLVAVVVFLLLRLGPGDPAVILAGDTPTFFFLTMEKHSGIVST
jgi:ABC-type dipeptide/oligopeptide/nickel transport system permease component